MPILVSYESPSSNKAALNAECSIYGDLNSDKLSLLCGDLDDHSRSFMQAGMAAIGYCHFRQTQILSTSEEGSAPKYLVPYFKGPSTFVASMGETTNGNHHNEYQTDHGLQFHCVEAHDPSEEEEPISNDLNL